MKTPTVLLVAAVLTTIVISACEYNEPEPPRELTPYRYIQVFTDPETKCEYLVNVQGGITPRVAANGLQYGCTYDY